jgi:hypothetical protein
MSDLQTGHTVTRAYRHPLEIAPLVFGLVFLGVVLAWLLYETEVVSGSDAAWLLPAVLVGAGTLGVVLAALRPRSAAAPYPAWAEPSAAWPGQAYGEDTATAYDELMAHVPPPETPPAGPGEPTPGDPHDTPVTDEPGAEARTEHKERDDD